jgi:cbb3-type cytochrome oxidase subunit 1
MARIDALFLRAAVVYAILGIVLGIVMAATQDHSQMPTHAHVNLLGWVSMALYAVVYRVWPEAARSRLAWPQFWLANGGTLVLVIGVAGIMQGYPESFEPLASIGSLASLAAMLLFAVVVFTRVPATQSAREGAERTSGEGLHATG